MELTPGMQPSSSSRAGSHIHPQGWIHLQPQDAKFPPGCSRDQDGIWSREPMVIPSRWNSCEKAGYELGSRPGEKPKALRAACSCWPVPALPARTSWGGLASHQLFPGSPSLSLRYQSPKQHPRFGMGKNKPNPRKAGDIGSRVTPRTQIQKRTNLIHTQEQENELMDPPCAGKEQDLSSLQWREGIKQGLD